MLDSVIEESSEMLTELVDRASELGYLTTQDILQLFPQAEDSASLLEELFNFLYDAGVEIQLDEPGESSEAAEDDDHKDRRYKFGYAMFDLSQISVDDSVGLYLKEMASVPLLKIEEEVDLAKRYERGRKAAARLIAGGRRQSSELPLSFRARSAWPGRPLPRFSAAARWPFLSDTDPRCRPPIYARGRTSRIRTYTRALCGHHARPHPPLPPAHRAESQSRHRGEN